MSTSDVDDRDLDPDLRGCWIVDAMNVIGSRPDGWWHDRDGALRRLVERTSAWAATRTDVEVVVVADGDPVDGLAEGMHGAVRVRYASRRGRNAADDRIVELVDELVATGAHDPVTVVTADRDLRVRVGDLGAHVVGPRTFRRHLDVDDGA